MSNREIRFAIASPENRARAASWVVCSNNNSNDIYVACRELGSAIKVSLHESGEWRLAYDFNFYAEKVAEDIPKNKDRLIHKWSRGADAQPGFTLALRIVTLHSAVTPHEDGFDDLLLVNPTADREATEIGIILTDKNVLVRKWPTKSSMNSNLIGSYQLPDDSTVWVVSWGCDVPDFSSLPNKFRYFKGVTEADVSDSLRAMVFGDHTDGSKVLYDLLVAK